MRIDLDIAKWRSLPACERTWGLPDSENPEVVRFALIGRSDIIAANVRDGAIEIFPDRSSQHAALKAVLVG